MEWQIVANAQDRYVVHELSITHLHANAKFKNIDTISNYRIEGLIIDPEA